MDFNKPKESNSGHKARLHFAKKVIQKCLKKSCRMKAGLRIEFRETDSSIILSQYLVDTYKCQTC